MANTKLPYDDNWGTFFGPNQRVVVRRVVVPERNLSLQKNQPKDLGVRTMMASRFDPPTNKKPTFVPVSSLASLPKAQILKYSRDYSFLSSYNETENPIFAPPLKDPIVVVVSAQNSVACPRNKNRQVYSIDIPQGSKFRALSCKILAEQATQGKKVSAVRAISPNPNACNQQKKVKPPSKQASLPSKNSVLNCVVPENNRPLVSNKSGIGPKVLSSELQAKATQKKQLSVTCSKSPKSMAGGDQKKTAPSSKLQSSVVTKKQLVQKKVLLQETMPEKPLLAKNPAQVPTLLPQIQDIIPQKPLLAKNPAEVPTFEHQKQQHRPKKRPRRRYVDVDEDSEDGFDDGTEEGPSSAAISSMIRKMFGYDPNRYKYNDRDDECMEANFEDIMREEKRSAKIARREDAEEARKIAEEEKEERMMKLARELVISPKPP